MRIKIYFALPSPLKIELPSAAYDILIGTRHETYSFALEGCNSTTTLLIDFSFEIEHVNACLLVTLLVSLLCINEQNCFGVYIWLTV